jgi:hypothetical protein
MLARGHELGCSPVTVYRDAFITIAQEVTVLLRIDSPDLRKWPRRNKRGISGILMADVEHYDSQARFHEWDCSVYSTGP